jgi:hypothetical protein
MTSTTFPYNLFVIEQLKFYSLQELESLQDPLNILTIIPLFNSSLFLLYKKDIDKFISDPRYKAFKSFLITEPYEFQKLSADFFSKNFQKTEEIFTFCQSIYKYKYDLIDEKKNLSDFRSIKRKGDFEKKILGKNIYYINPLYVNNFEYYKNHINLKDKIDDELINALENIYFGYQFDITLPSIGPIYSIYENKNDIYSFINKLINYDGTEDITEYLPLVKQHIDEIIANILLEDKNKNNFWNNINIKNNKEDNNFKYITNYIKGINVKLGEVISDKDFKLKKKYIIPYEISSTGDIKYIKNIIIPSLKKITNSSNKDEYNEKEIKEKFIDKNNNLIKHIISLIFINTPTKKINDTHIKDILCCYLFYVINIFYDFYKKYIDKLNEVIVELSTSTIGKDLNIKNAFNFIENLNKSLYNFKLILLNNFYNLFLPSKIDKNNYGMQLDKNGCYILEKNALGDNEFIIKNYPFQYDITTDFDANKNSFINFMISYKNKFDIYDKEKYLALGAFTYNKKITIDVLKELDSYNNKIIKKNELNLNLITYLEKILKDKVIINFVKDITEFFKDSNFEKKNEIKNELLKKYRLYKMTSASYYIKVLSINEKLKKNKKIIVNNKKLKDIYTLAYNIFNLKAEVVKIFTIKKTFDLKSKDIILKKYDELLREITKKIWDIKNRYQNNNNINNKEINKKNKMLNQDFWVSLHNTIKNKKVLIPFLVNKSKTDISFINITDLAYQGKFSDDLIINIDTNINKLSNYYIILGKTKKSIDNKMFLTLNNFFIEKMKTITSETLIRKNIFSLLTDTIIYNKYTEKILSKSTVYKNILEKYTQFKPHIISHNQIEKILFTI